MYGPGIAPPPPRPAGRARAIGLRVLFTVLPPVTLGIAAWGSILWLAVRFRRPLDWALIPVVAAIDIGGILLIGMAEDENSAQSNIGASGLFFCMLAVPVYVLVMDILRSSWAARAAAGHRPFPYQQGYWTGPVQGPGPHGTPGPSGYGYGQPQPQPQPHQAPTQPQHQAAPQQRRQPPVPPGPPVPGPSAAPAPHPRINQVRAELDELSDYLRKEEGR